MCVCELWSALLSAKMLGQTRETFWNTWTQNRWLVNELEGKETIFMNFDYEPTKSRQAFAPLNIFVFFIYPKNSPLVFLPSESTTNPVASLWNEKVDWKRRGEMNTNVLLCVCVQIKVHFHFETEREGAMKLLREKPFWWKREKRWKWRWRICGDREKAQTKVLCAALACVCISLLLFSLGTGSRPRVDQLGPYVTHAKDGRNVGA